jgi:hypothetical protein
MSSGAILGAAPDVELPIMLVVAIVISASPLLKHHGMNL